MSEYDDLLAGVRKGQPAMATGDDYESLLAKVRKPDPSIVQASNINASFYKPDAEAEKQKVARDLQSMLGEEWSPAAVDPADARRRLQIVENDHVLRNSPKLADNFLNPQFANIAHDDVKTLGDIERTVSGTMRDIAVTGLKGAVGLPQAIVGLADIPTFGYVGKGLDAAGFKFNESQKILDSMYSPAQQRANKEVSGADGFVDTIMAALQNPSVIATTVGESIPQMMGGAGIGRKLLEFGGKRVAASMAGPELPSWLVKTFGEKWAPILASASGEGVLGAGSAAEQIRGEQDDGLLSAKQSLSALGSGVGTALFSVVGGKMSQKLGIADIDTALVKGGMDQPTAEILKKGFVRKFAEAGVSEGVFEELPQSVQEQMWQNFATDKPVMDGVGNAAAMGLLAGVATGGSAEGYHHVAYGLGEMRQKELDAQQATKLGDMLSKFSMLSEASLMRNRDHETAQTFFQSIMEDGHDSVFITPDALAKSGMAEQIAQFIPSVTAQLDSAATANHDIELPIAELMAKFPGQDLVQTIIPHVSATPGGFTPTTSQEYMQSDKAQELQGIVDQVLTGKNVDADFRASQQVVKDAVLSTLNTVGRNTPAVNEAYATLHSSYAAVRGVQLGMTPEQFFTKHMIKVKAEGRPGDAYEQSDNDLLDLFKEADTINIEAPKMSEQEIDDAQRVFLSHFPESVETYRRSSGIARRIRKASDDATDVIGDNPEAPRVVDSPLGPFSGYRAEGVTIAPDDSYNPGGVLKVRIYGKEQVEAGLIEEPALTFTVMQDGELSVNGPTPGGATFNAFKERGWAEQSKAGDQIAEGWSNLVNPEGGKMPMPQTIALLADVHARVRAWKMEEYTGLHWARATGALAGTGDYGSAMFLQGGEKHLGSFSPTENLITLLKDANLSTFLHESGHYFFETDIKVAGEILSAARIHGFDTLTEGEKQILADVSALMDWHGIHGDVAEQLRQWEGMDLEERRVMHERTAESFEKYLFEGNAPSIELHAYFQKFSAWLTKVYSSIKDFLSKNPEAGKLNDEVRGVFDRMLATNEQIKMAEQARSMIAMFQTAEQAGMTEEEFAAYHKQDTQGALYAVSDLQAKTLRDMKWLRNARSRALKNLQKEVASIRAETEMAARRQIMAEPIYQACQFLTGKVTADDKIENPKAPKSPKDQIDETMDSLFVAIAKLGGIDKAEAIGAWGIDPVAKPSSGIVGKPLWRIEGGMSLDGMREALAQYGYTEDDLRDFEGKFKAELSGDQQYSNAYDPGQFNLPEDGAQVTNHGAVTAGRLALPALEALGLPVELVNHIKALKMTDKEGWHPDIIAERFGFSSGEDMLRRVAVAEAPKEAIAGLTDKMLLEQHSDLATPQGIERAADMAVFNEARARFVATELAAAEKLAGKQRTLITAAKQYADAIISRMQIKSIKPNQFASAETRAAKAADKAHRSGDAEQSAVEKRNQVINLYATKAAYAAQEEANAFRRSMSEFAARSDKKLKAYDIDLVNAVRAILGEYGIAERRAKSAAEYLEVFQTNDPDMYSVIAPSIQYAERNAKPFNELTVEEMRALKDEIGAVLHLARRARQSEVDGDLIDREEIIGSLDARLNEIGVPDKPMGDSQAVSEGELRMVQLRTALANMTRAESWVDKMDGLNPMGPFRTYLFNRIKDAADAYRTDKAKYLREFRGLVDAIAPTLKPMIIEAPELGYTFGKDSGGSAMNEILHAILHTGNASNKRKMLLGRKWATEISEGVIDPGKWDAFINRLVKEGKLTKEHFDFVQGVWDLLESTKPMAQKTHRDVFGKYFDEVTADAFTDPFGTQRRGGYVPAMADSRVVTDAKLRGLAETENASMAFAFPTTAKGFTKSRTEYNRPLLLDLRSLAQHIDKVLLFSHMEMPVRDVQRLTKEIGGKLDRLDPGIIAGLITPWLNRAAKQQVVTPITADAGFSRFLSVARSRAGAAAMFANVANAVQQISGFSLAAVKVRPALMLSSTASFMKNPRAVAKTVAEASPYMAERMENEVSSMSDEINAILLNPTLLQKGQMWTQRHAYFLQSAVDNVMSPIIWTAAYNQAIEQKQDHKNAVRLADAAVRQTQGSTLPEDVSRAETGNAFVRLFTQFASYFNMQANLLGTEFSKVMQDYGLRKGAGRGMYIFMFGFLAPVVVGEAVMQLFRGGPDDDDKDGEYLDDWLAQLFIWAPQRTLTAMIPVAGTVINSSINAWNKKPYDDRIASSPAVSMVESAAKALPELYKTIVEGEGNWKTTVRDVSTLISMTVGLPANVAARPLGYEAGVEQGKISPTSSADYARGLLTGTASPESKN